jgi:uncharacterized protein
MKNKSRRAALWVMLPAIGSDPIHRRRVKRVLAGVLGLLLLAIISINVIAWNAAHTLTTNPVATPTRAPSKTPADFQLPFVDVLVTNAEGLKLVGWLVPSQNGGMIIAQHGYRANRAEMLPAAAILRRHGYGVLITSVRAHDRCDDEQITFGFREHADMETWLDYLLTRADFDHNRIGALGNSMGGMLVIQLAAGRREVKAVATDCAFSSLKDTMYVSVPHYAHLPAIPFAPLSLFWARFQTGCDPSAIDAKKWIAEFQSQPVFLMQGGADTTISPKSGERLFNAAHQPKELWFEPALKHAKFSTDAPEYEQRVAAFFDKYLSPGGNSTPGDKLGPNKN